MDENIEEENVITYEQVEERLKNVPIAEYTAQDVQDRYIAYGDDEDLDRTEIQLLLLKHNYVEELIYSVPFVITDKSVIEGVYASNIFESTKFMSYEGRIDNIKLVEDKNEDPRPHTNLWFPVIEFVEKESQKRFSFKGKFLRPSETEAYKNKVELHKDNVIAIVENRNNKLRLVCLVKVYEDIEYGADNLLEEVIKIVVNTGQVSTSLIQRKFKISYAHTLRLLDQMEQRGIISEHEEGKPIQVIVTED